MASKKRAPALSPTTTGTEPVLSLSSVVTRKKIRIDGALYDLRHADELPWLAYRHRAGQYQRAGELLSIKRRTKAQDAELDRVLPDLVQAIVVAPPAVLAKLSPEHRLGIVAVFSELLMKDRPDLIAAPTKPGQASSKRTGGRSSRGSHGSTAAIPTAGLRRSRSAS